MSSAVTFDEKSYFVHGKRIWIASGEFQYFRMTRADWRPRLLQAKLAGFNAVSVYFPWNWHEVREGEWDFTGNKDAEAFLRLAAEIGLYVVARPGPYICNEWQGGGIPAWLAAKEGVRMRTADPVYLSACDAWFDKIVPIIARCQVDQGGSVILAQVENEYAHMGEYQEPAYVYHLRDALRAHGVTVPIINCDSYIQFGGIVPLKWEGINPCCNLGGDGIRKMGVARKLQDTSPLLVTEYWIACFDWFGSRKSSVDDAHKSLYGGLEMIAGGIGGLTMFVFAGGANFAYWHGGTLCSDYCFISTLYGPGAPILDDGRFSEKYNVFKRHFTGLTSVSEVLAGAGMPELEGDMNGLIKATRRNGDTSFLFYVNHSKEQMEIADAQKGDAACDMTIPAGMVRWEVQGLPLQNGLTMARATASLFAANPALVFYAPAGQAQEIRLSGAYRSVSGGDSHMEDGQLVLTGAPAGDGTPLCWQVVTDEGALWVALIAEEAIDGWYRVDLPGVKPCLVGGFERVEDIQIENGAVYARAFGEGLRNALILDEGGLRGLPTQFVEARPSREVALTDWRTSYSFPEAMPEYDDKDWFASEQPSPMQRFGSGNGRAWYRAVLHVPVTGWQHFTTSGACDRFLIFIDGEFKMMRGAHTHMGNHLRVWLTEGDHVMAILAENLGMYNTGAEWFVPLGEPKGIYGPCWLNGREIVSWRMREGTRQGETYENWPAVGDIPWETCASETVKGPCWLKASFDLTADDMGAVRLKVPQAGKGSVWINGFNIGRYWNVGPHEDMWIPASLLREHNQLVLLEEESIQPDCLSVSFTSHGAMFSAKIN